MSLPKCTKMVPLLLISGPLSPKIWNQTPSPREGFNGGKGEALLPILAYIAKPARRNFDMGMGATFWGEGPKVQRRRRHFRKFWGNFRKIVVWKVNQSFFWSFENFSGLPWWIDQKTVFTKVGKKFYSLSTRYFMIFRMTLVSPNKFVRNIPPENLRLGDNPKNTRFGACPLRSLFLKHAPALPLRQYF